MNKGTGLLAMLALAVLVLAGCSAGNSQDTGNDKPNAPAIPVEVAEARMDSITAFYSATATLEAEREATVVPRVPGRITELVVEEGDRVAAGDVLARIDDERLKLELARAEAELSRLRQDYARQREMHERNLISTEAFERLKFEFEAQQAQVELARLELSYTAISAPIEGIVSERMVKAGNMVSTTDPVFRITAMDPLRAVLHVPERELARLEPGQPAVLRADALPGERFVGEVVRISPVIDADSGTFRVTVLLGDGGERLRPGMFGRFDIVYDRREQAVLVPVEAVLREDGQASVFVIEGSEAQRRRVETGYRNNGHLEVVSGLAAGERVVVTGQASLRSGATVQVLGEDLSESRPAEALAEADTGAGHSS